MGKRKTSARKRASDYPPRVTKGRRVTDAPQESAILHDERQRDAEDGRIAATPDQAVDDVGAALGVPRAPDEEFRPSVEILEGRDRYRWEQEE